MLGEIDPKFLEDLGEGRKYIVGDEMREMFAIVQSTNLELGEQNKLFMDLAWAYPKDRADKLRALKPEVRLSLQPIVDELIAQSEKDATLDSEE